MKVIYLLARNASGLSFRTFKLLSSQAFIWVDYELIRALGSVARSQIDAFNLFTIAIVHQGVDSVS